MSCSRWLPATARALVVALVASFGGGCIEGSGGRPLGSSCTSDGECEGALVCSYGLCRAACAFDRDCGEGRACVADVATGAWVCTDIDEGGCDPEIPSSCPDGLVCDPEEGLCRSPCEVGCGDGRECRDGLCVDGGSCTRPDHCRLGCRCEGGSCVPLEGLESEASCETGPGPLELGDDDERTLLVDTAEDEDDCPGNEAGCDPMAGTGGLSLREALGLARASGPNRIRFAESVPWASEVITLGAEALPSVPSLTYVDGEVEVGHVSIVGNAETAAGLTIDGLGVAVSDLAVTGCSGPGVRVAHGSAGVHLFGMRVGGREVGNGEGIAVEDSARDVWISRGRELRGVSPLESPNPNNNTGDCAGAFDSADVNVILGNRGPGISANGAEQLHVMGTWIGFDPLGPYESPCDDCVNAEAGIELIDVSGARVGAFDLTAEEVDGLVTHIGSAMDGTDSVRGMDPMPGFVLVGNSGGAGIVVQGGEDVRIAGVWIGATYCPSYWDREPGPAIEIASPRGPVQLGPLADGPPRESPLFVFALSSVTPVHVENNLATVTLRNLHAGTFGSPDFAVQVHGAGAPVAVHHASITGSYGRAAVGFLSPSPGGSLEVINSFFWHSSTQSVPVVFAEGDRPARISGSVQYTFSDWCEGSCDVDAGTCEAATSWPDECVYRVMYPLSPECPQIDRGVETGFDRVPMTGRTVHGCGPDVGAFECSSPSCIAAGCD